MDEYAVNLFLVRVRDTDCSSGFSSVDEATRHLPIWIYGGSVGWTCLLFICFYYFSPQRIPSASWTVPKCKQRQWNRKLPYIEQTIGPSILVLATETDSGSLGSHTQVFLHQLTLVLWTGDVWGLRDLLHAKQMPCHWATPPPFWN